MVIVKVIKLPDGVSEDDKYIKLNQIYEAFELADPDATDDFFNHFFALNIGIGTYIIRPECVVIIENDMNEKVSDNNVIIKSSQQKILLVEEFSVNKVEELEEWCNKQNIKLIVCRKGANKPEWLNL